MKKLLTLIIAVLLTTALVGGGIVAAEPAITASEIEATVFGPEMYLRTAGPPNVYTDSFSIRADYDATITMGKLIVYNGEKERADPTRARDATIILNGCEVLDSTDIGEAVHVIVLPVKLEQDNDIIVVVRGKPGSYLTVQVDYETGPTGPVFSGPQQYPFIARTEQSGLGQPLVDNHEMGIPIYEMDEYGTKTDMIGYSKDGSIPTRVDYFYRTTGGQFVRLDDPADRPADLAQTTTTEGLTVDYIVRLERGTINRFIYALAMLAPCDGLESPWDSWDMSAWNGRLLYRFDGGVGIGHSQGRLSMGDPLYHDALSRGYSVAYSTGTRTGVHYNLVLGGETALMVKDHFVTRYGEPEYTISIGGSGGAIQQYVYAQNHPGLLDGIIPQACYPDMHTQTIPVGDGMLLEYYFDVVAPGQGDYTFGGFDLSGFPFVWPYWTGSILPRTWIEGTSSSDTMPHPVYYPLTGHLGSTEMVNGWLGLTPMCLNPLWHTVSGVDLWYPQEQVEAVKWTHPDDLVNIFGLNDYGYARRSWDNVGVQYGLQALKDGLITVEQFLDINARIGGWKESHEMVQEGFPFVGGFDPFNFDPWSIRNANIAVNEYGVAPRTEGDIEAIESAWESGIVFLGELGDVPIIDMRQYLDPWLDMHNARQSFSARARMIDAQGHADNQLIWVADRFAPPRDFVGEAFELLDEWITNIQAHPELGVVGNKPESATDMAYFADGSEAVGPDVWDGILNDDPPGPGTTAFPPFSSPRMVAGGDIQGDIFKTYLIPVEEAVAGGFYDPVVLTPEQIERLEEIFPTGVADYSQGCVGRPEGLTRADVIQTLP
jgi:hypothetical protein